MKRNARAIWVIGLSVAVLFVISFITIKMIYNHAEGTNEMPFSEEDHIKLSFDEVVSQATHIIEAEYVGDYISEYDHELMFNPVKVLKGQLDTDDNSIIYVQSLLEVQKELSEYNKDETYLLFLEKNSSVYYEHDKYVQLGDLQLSSNDSEWQEHYKRVETALTDLKNQAPTSYGVEYTNSTDMREILSVSKNIFVVKIEEIYAKSTVSPTTVYHSNVTKTIKNTPVDGNILITFFNDTVEIGGEYVVLLADATDTAPVYSLSSKESVYTLEEAYKIPELEELMKESIDFD